MIDAVCLGVDQGLAELRDLLQNLQEGSRRCCSAVGVSVKIRQGKIGERLDWWWVESGLSKLEFARHRHVEYYFWVVGGVIEPKYYAFRIGFAKLSALITYLDGVYDTYGTYEELQLFIEAIKKWDPSATKGLPEYMKIAYIAFYDGVKDMWEVYIDSYMQEAKWLVEGYVPSLEEYLDNGKVIGGSRVVTLQPILAVDAILPDNILPEIDYPSKFDELLGLTLRVKGDTRTFEGTVNGAETKLFSVIQGKVASIKTVILGFTVMLTQKHLNH
ncbi:alpha pinene synthase, chloroplastic-like [Cryptomeria japonica]|uniref:alpha pinene synthase, chloroplastic-like n=1 Tax=Cryptomeria japonica TaxID=3369 RepID=UPI0027DAA365|nr:alpha pinene synthase, chloroplastic-like [Cryptomeria japonica]